jgi:hypothetical protein
MGSSGAFSETRARQLAAALTYIGLLKFREIARRYHCNLHLQTRELMQIAALVDAPRLFHCRLA